MREAVGAMMKAVRNSVRPITIWFDGISCVPIACRRKWNTIAIRVNDVIMISAAGTNVSSVSRTTICSGAETVPTPLIWSETFWAGGAATVEIGAALRAGGAANAGAAHNRRTMAAAATERLTTCDSLARPLSPARRRTMRRNPIRRASPARSAPVPSAGRRSPARGRGEAGGPRR